MGEKKGQRKNMKERKNYRSMHGSLFGERQSNSGDFPDHLKVVGLNTALCFKVLKVFILVRLMI